MPGLLTEGRWFRSYPHKPKTLICSRWKATQSQIFLAFYLSTISNAKRLPGVYVLLRIYAQLPEICVILVKLQLS